MLKAASFPAQQHHDHMATTTAPVMMLSIDPLPLSPNSESTANTNAGEEIELLEGEGEGWIESLFENEQEMMNAFSVAQSVIASTTTMSTSTTSVVGKIDNSPATSGGQVWNAVIKTTFARKYWRNDKKILLCFPFCSEFGVDFREIKMRGLEHTGKKPCRMSIDASFCLPAGFVLRDVMILGRFVMVSPQLCATEGCRLFIDGDSVREDELNTELRIGGIPGRVLFARGISSNEAIAFETKIERDTMVEIQFAPKDWMLNITLPRTRRAQNDVTKVPLYSFELIVFVANRSTGTLNVVSRAISQPFQITSLRTLLREVAANGKGSDGDASTSSSSKPAPAPKAASRKSTGAPKSSAAASRGSKATAATAIPEKDKLEPLPVFMGEANSWSPAPAQTFSTTAKSIPSVLVKRDHDEFDDTPLNLAFEEQELPSDLFTDEEMFDLDKLLDEAPLQDRKKVKSEFVRRVMEKKRRSAKSLGGTVPAEAETTDSSVATKNTTIAATTATRTKSISTAPVETARPSVAEAITPVPKPDYLPVPAAAPPPAIAPASAASSAIAAPDSSSVALDLDLEIKYNFDLRRQAPTPDSATPPVFSTNAANEFAPRTTNASSLRPGEISIPIERVSMNSSIPQSFSLFDAYFFWLLFGIVGGHHYYLGKPEWGFLYTITAGIFLVGWLIDGIYMKDLVDDANNRKNSLTFTQFLLLYIPPLGMFGFHHFAIGRIGFGFYYLFTFGGFLFGWITDMTRLKALWEDYTASQTPLGQFYSFDQNLMDAYVIYTPLGLFGAHHFFLGNHLMGIAYVFTVGFLGVGFIHDGFNMRTLVIESRSKYGLD